MEWFIRSIPPLPINYYGYSHSIIIIIITDIYIHCLLPHIVYFLITPETVHCRFFRPTDLIACIIYTLRCIDCLTANHRLENPTHWWKQFLLFYDRLLHREDPYDAHRFWGTCISPLSAFKARTHEPVYRCWCPVRKVFLLLPYSIMNLERETRKRIRIKIKNCQNLESIMMTIIASPFLRTNSCVHI